ncbi:hypothetical protein Tco_0916455 [Tanacetum coccineum]
MKAAYYPDVGLEQLVPDQFWIAEECKYDIAAMYGISHWWFQRQRFYIDRFSSEGDRRAVRTHMRILSVIRIEVFSMYGYNYMKKIVLRRADLKEYVIAERDFKHMYPSDFEDLYLLNLQGHLNHLSPEDKKILTTAVNLWTRNLVIRHRVEDFQLGIESYQTQLNLTKPRWEATGFEFKHDYTEQGLHVRYPETAKDTTYLSESGELCGWTDPRRRLPVIEENRMRGSTCSHDPARAGGIYTRDNSTISDRSSLGNGFNSFAVSITRLIDVIDDKYHGLSDMAEQPSMAILKIPPKDSVSLIRREQVGPHGSRGSSKDGNGDSSFQWSQFTTQCSHLSFPSKGTSWTTDMTLQHSFRNSEN